MLCCAVVCRPIRVLCCAAGHFVSCRLCCARVCLQLTTVKSCCSCAGEQHHCLLALSQQLVHLLPSDSQVQAEWGNVTTVIAGLTNTYSSYVTTFEEYQEQRYEGASTIFGPHTLDAYIQVCLIWSPLPCPAELSAAWMCVKSCPALLSGEF